MKMPDKEMRTRDYGAWLDEIGSALLDELRAGKISYLDALRALEDASRLLNAEAMSRDMDQNMEVRHG